MTALQSIALVDYYEHTYRPDKHALPQNAKTRDQFRVDLNHLNNALSHYLAERGEPVRPVRLSDLESDGDAIVKYAMAWQVGRGRAAGTANKLYRTICAIWRDAIERGHLSQPPRTKAYKLAKHEPRCWSLEECSQLFAAAERAPGTVGGVTAGEFFRAYFWFVYATGARQGVTLGFPVANFDPERGEILLPAALQKQNADQAMELLPQAVAAVAALKSRARGLDRLFGDWTGHVTNFNKRLKKIIVAAGLRPTVKDVTRWDLSHKLRRTFATHVCANSDEETARKLLGHSHVSVTRRYLDARFLPHASARELVPPLPTIDGDPPPSGGEPETQLRIHRPDADEPRQTA
jgi:integrase